MLVSRLSEWIIDNKLENIYLCNFFISVAVLHAPSYESNLFYF